jgi:calcineurin-like phosphoesterase family protein
LAVRRGEKNDRRSATSCSLLIAFACLAGCAQTTLSPEKTDAGEAAFVVVGVDGQAIARVITHSAECPVLIVDDAPQPMTVRAAPGTVPLRPTKNAPEESKPSAFPVLVCDALLGARTIRASVGGHALPVPKSEPKRIVIIGDTGCRLKRADGKFQACNDRDAWPFEDVAAAAAASHPDLVVHVGDYHYRENPCPAGDAGCAGSPWGYGWDAWNADFFAPARKLLQAAPWIVVRGNHESCDRAGQGWWRFLDPRPPMTASDCNDPAFDAVGDFSEPYAVPVAADTQFVVFDSSKVGVEPLAAGDPMHGTYTAQLKNAFALANRRAGLHNLFVNHHPILGFAPDPRREPTGVYPGNGSLQSVLRPINGPSLFPRSIDAVIAGHVHLFEMVSYSTPQPTQLVSGNGGAWADVPLPRPLPPGATPAAGATIQSIASTHRPGFLLLERDGSTGGTWRIEARNRRGDPLTTCALAEHKTRCAPEVLP